MNLWVTIGIAAGLVLLLKIAGHYVPRSWVSSPRVVPVVTLVSVALLAGLVAVQTLDGGHHLVIDARLVAVAVAAIAYWRKVPFIAVVVLAAAVAAGLRLLGWG